MCGPERCVGHLLHTIQIDNGNAQSIQMKEKNDHNEIQSFLKKVPPLCQKLITKPYRAGSKGVSAGGAEELRRTEEILEDDMKLEKYSFISASC